MVVVVGGNVLHHVKMGGGCPGGEIYIHLYSPHSGSNHTHIYKINLTVNSK